MTIVAHPLLGRWCIFSADLWDRDHLDPRALSCPPTELRSSWPLASSARPHWRSGPNGDGEIAFGALQASLDAAYGSDKIGFTWSGFDKMDEVTAKHLPNSRPTGSLQIEFECHNGGEAALRAGRKPSSTAC